MFMFKGLRSALRSFASEASNGVSLPRSGIAFPPGWTPSREFITLALGGGGLAVYVNSRAETRSDKLEARAEARSDRLEARSDKLEASLAEQRREMRQDMRELRQEMRQAMGELRQEMGKLQFNVGMLVGR